MIQFLHQCQQLPELAGRKTFAGEPIEILPRQIGDQAAFVFTERHLAGNQKLQVFGVHKQT